MVKKGLVLVASLAALLGVGSTCQAQIIPAKGPGQIGYTAVVLCDSLSVRQESSTDSETVKTLHYGDKFMVTQQKDGWAECMLSDAVDAAPEGWVKSEYVAIDPAWYSTDEQTNVYAWNDVKAYKIAQLSENTVLPVLKDDGDWLCVGLRGASGWIQKTDADRAAASDEKKASEQKKDSGEKKASSEQSQNSSGQDTDDAGTTDEFTVFGENGSTAYIHWVAGATYEDEDGRTFVNQDDGVYYCIPTDVTYYSDAGAVPDYSTYDDDDDDNDDDDGDDDGYTGADYGEGAGLENNWEDTENYTGADYGEGAGLEDNWADTEDIGKYYGEGAGLEDNWADYE